MSGPGIEIKAWLPSDSFLWDWHVHLPWIILAGGFIRWIPLWISLGENYHWFNVLTGLIIDIVISGRKECRPRQYWTSKCLTCPIGDIRLFNQHDVFLVQLQGPRWWKFLILDILHDHRTACPMDCSKVDKLTGMLCLNIYLPRSLSVPLCFILHATFIWSTKVTHIACRFFFHRTRTS